VSQTDSKTGNRTAHAVPAAGVERPAELVVLLDDGDQPIGTADKQRVHSEETPLHLAFSCYIFDDTGRLLVTRRALTKRAWPGVWTNSCCGHPAPDEDIADTVRRRVRQELGMDLADLRLALPDFRYRATAPDGVVENEFCPVYVARSVDQPRPDPTEVLEWRWANWNEFVTLATVAPWAISPWATLQVPLLANAL
jgi:isopentenyl-diphosphate delta-isomerase